jgi:hypothetical protein
MNGHTLLALGLAVVSSVSVQSQVVRQDEARVSKVSITVALVADGANGIRADQSAELLRMNDRILGVSLTSNGSPICTQRSSASRRTGTRRCGFGGFFRCPVETTRTQECPVLVDCKYMLFRSDQRFGACDKALSRSTVGATSNFVPAVRPDVCEANCDQPGWRTRRNLGPAPTAAGTPLGNATIEIERPY